MITVEKTIKSNGELTPTRKYPFEVKDREEMEKERARLEKHYNCPIYFKYREPDPKLETQGGIS